jgi:cell division protein FtsB
MLKRIFNIFKNKYFLVTVAFAVWLVFFDQNNIISQIKLSRKLKEIRQQKEYYLEEIRKNENATDELMSDSAHLEKFAREKYLMKKDNEDVYLIEDKQADSADKTPEEE